MNKVLIIDRDGTILVEPPVDFQIDSIAKTDFVPGAISGMKAISTLGYELVMCSNQDGLGTASFPMEDFLPPQEMMLKVLASEGVKFDDILIDPTMPEENAPTRKPGIGMFGKYLTGEYDLPGSYVIGDRITDVMLAKNLGARAILLQEANKASDTLAEKGLTETCALCTTSWSEIAEYLRRTTRVATTKRNTRETQISVSVDLDGRMPSSINTGLKFFDHMLDQIAHHGGLSLQIQCKGDLEVDEHHTMEDVAIALGDTLREALGDKRGIERYGFALPMDECKALVLLDLGGRIDFDWDVTFTREYVGDTPTEMFRHFFYSLCAALRCNLHISARGENNHHLIEGVFKAFARSLRTAIHRQPFNYDLPSSKGVL
ncbi:MAG: bifunctional histidinol-phosphatase/imidazoleglycerol-phosphate dehydratase HisB [Bacteroidaceae bacterium]|nr:bifunctional histidinol-phosphatase/imidazoleglycerol-phosphate dehydratase HisB [Bacteroidaceae bacterium]